MMEQTDARKRHCDTILVASLDHVVIAYRAAGLGNKLHTALMGALDIVTEGEEGIRTESYLRVLGDPRFLLFHRQHLGLLLEELLSGTVTKHVIVLVL